jgi:hypothetical protein
MASKYDGLGTFLTGQHGADVPMTFSEIERVTGVPLPPRAQHSRAWWSNNPSNNVMTKVWLEAGFETAQVDVPGRRLIFRRTRRPAPEDAASNRAHPLVGCMKGTFSIEPGADLTKPVLDAKVLAEMVASIQRTADLIEAGLARKFR